ncbi:hypothetical protein [Nostoc sp. DedQUE07]|uniref:hypothetical protein n=1 Tax=Nostoc sp. DedQUE07 TaxID=3075392 RepID=UPI002AD46F05|nr:hypothetical protein [Nostoc sp. DedQUE07]MDZ8130599.1 hypothetical protein [Nostoc sp. DedQUE07]
MLHYHLLAICQFAVWDIADLGVGVARTSTRLSDHRRHRALRCGDRTYLNLVSSYLCDYTCNQLFGIVYKIERS